MKRGKVLWFSTAKGYGFIKPEDGSKDIFVHYSAIEGDGYRSLAPQQPVEFEVVPGDRGPQAGSVRKV